MLQVKKPYEIILCGSVLSYLRMQKTTGYRKSLTEFTESGFPKICSMGYTQHTEKRIVVLKKFNWERRLWHEVGHEVGFRHVSDKSNIMYPYINRGTKGIEGILDCYMGLYGYIGLLKLKNIYIMNSLGVWNINEIY